MTEMMSRNGQRVVVIGGAGPLLEGVSDLLQLAGYEVRTAASWDHAFASSHSTSPNLAILDISHSVTDNEGLSSLLDSLSMRTDSHILVVSFAGDNRIHDLERLTGNNHNGRLHFYAHTLVGAEGLIEKVDSCFS